MFCCEARLLQSTVSDVGPVIHIVLRSSSQWRNDGVAAASRDGGPTSKGASTVPEFLVINLNVCVCCY